MGIANGQLKAENLKMARRERFLAADLTLIKGTRKFRIRINVISEVKTPAMNSQCSVRSMLADANRFLEVIFVA